MKVSWIILFVLIGLIVGAGTVFVKLRMERTAYEDEIGKLNDRFDLVKKKYSEEKQRANGLLRVKSTLEGRIRALRADLETFETEKAKVLKANAALQAKLEENTTSCEEAIQAVSDRYDKVSKQYEKLNAKYVETMSSYEEKVKSLIGEKNDLDMTLNETEYNLGRCEKHNSEFARIADELIVKYRDKGVVDSIAQKEPFTGLKQIEIEKLIQEYQDKIDDHQLEN